jgi:hypothetical protein
MMKLEHQGGKMYSITQVSRISQMQNQLRQDAGKSSNQVKMQNQNPAYKVTIGGQEQGSGKYNRNGEVNNGMSKKEFGAAVVSATLDRLNSGANLRPGTYSAQSDSYHFNKDVLSSYLD